MTSQTLQGDWLSYGWKDGLRVAAEPTQGVGGLDEPGVWVQEERDYYGDVDTTNRIAVGASRLWIEQYVSTFGPVEATAHEAWIDNLNRDPNTPEFHPLQPAEGHPNPVGNRVVVAGDEVSTDMRAVGPVRMINSGHLALAVMAEGDWYRWARHYPAEPHPSL